MCFVIIHRNRYHRCIPNAACVWSQIFARFPFTLGVSHLAGTAATTGLTVPRLLDLLTQSLGLAAVPSSVLCAALYYVATTLDVDVESVLQLAIQQPTLLCAQVGLTGGHG